MRVGRRRRLDLLAAAALLCACGHDVGLGVSPPAPDQRLSAVRAMTEIDTRGVRRAIEPRDFDFPDDHGPHPGYKL